MFPRERRLDTSPLGENPLNRWVRRRQVDVELQQQVAKIVRDVGGQAPPSRSKSKLPGDARALRGIPMVGRGISGAIPSTRPGFKLFRETTEEV